MDEISRTNDYDDAEYVKEYGIGIDCHSQFIEVCIRYRNSGSILKAQEHFSTSWENLVPMDVRLVLRDEYTKYDQLIKTSEDIKAKIFVKARSDN